MLSKCYYSFALAMLINLNMQAGHHDDHNNRHGVKIEINIDGGHCHKKERSLMDKLGAGTVQVVENNAYLLSFGISALALGVMVKSGLRERDLPKAGLIGAGIWIGGGLLTRNVMLAIMSQCDIPKL